MSPDLFVTLFVLGGIGGFAAGLLGVGGGVVLFSLLLYVPPLLGLEGLHVKMVAALVISQVFFASVVSLTLLYIWRFWPRFAPLERSIQTPEGSDCDCPNSL